MKRVISCVLSIMIVISATVVCSQQLDAASYSCGSFSGYEIRLVNDNSGICFCAFKSKTLYIKQLNSDMKDYTYTFEYPILSYCISYGTAYVITASTFQDNVYPIFSVKDGKIEDFATILDKNLSSTAPIAVDSSENVYILNKNSDVDVATEGKVSVDTISGKYYGLFNLNGKAYAANNSTLSKLSKSGVGTVYSYSGGYTLYRVSDDYIADTSGNVYKFDSKVTEVANLSNTGISSFGESKKYLVSYNSSKLYAYDKDCAEVLAKYSISYTPYMLTCSGNKLFVIEKSGTQYTLHKYNSGDIFQEATDSSDSTDDSSAATLPSTIDLKSYKLKGKYIYVSQGTTVAVFKNSISYNGYEISFSKASGNIGSGVTVTLTKNSKSYKYIFVVLGDLTGEGSVNSRDISAMFNYLLGTQSLGKAYQKAADLNSDGKISNIDLVKLDKKIKN